MKSRSVPSHDIPVPPPSLKGSPVVVVEFVR